ncbi:MAG: hypothetical protein ACLS27_03655 [Eubacterium sp.]
MGGTITTGVKLYKRLSAGAALLPQIDITALKKSSAQIQSRVCNRVVSSAQRV